MTDLLRRENERLRRRIEELEELCGLDEKPRIKIDCPRSGRVAIVLSLLLRRELVSRSAVLLAIGRDDAQNPIIADVYVSHARKLLADWCIPLKTDWGRGWYVEKKYRQALRANLMGEEPKAA